jgi:signal transduction histidine kinase
VSIRLRLTVLYSVILALTLAAFGGLLYATQAHSTLNIVKGDLAREADRLAQAVVRAQHLMPRDYWLRMLWIEGMGGGPPSPGEPPQAPRDWRGRDVIRVLDIEGNSLDVKLNEQTEELPISQNGLAHIQNGQAWVEFGRDDEGRLLVHNEPIVIDGRVIGIVQLARSLADRDRSLNALGVALILGSTTTTVIAFGIGWLLAGVTLRPIHRITQSAWEIGETRDFGSRVPYQGPNDELGRLARTFNGMLNHLQDAYQQVTHALQVQRAFVADVSHELRTPLTTIRGNLALLHRDPPLPAVERQDVLHDLIGETERLIRLVTDLLTLARADAGRRLVCERVFVWPIVDEACRQSRTLEPGRAIDCQGTEDAVAQADPDALKQVLLTLLDNAIKYTEGPIEVEVGEENGRVTIDVEDSGPGIPPEMRERVFDRFYRGDVSRSTPGFGLGLSIARTLVEAQDGTLQLESKVSQGSRFTISIPTAAG